MSYYTDDPARDADRYSADRERELDKLPECSECGHPIQDETLFEINDELVCTACMIKNHRKWTEDYAM